MRVGAKVRKKKYQINKGGSKNTKGTKERENEIIILNKISPEM